MNVVTIILMLTYSIISITQALLSAVDNNLYKQLPPVPSFCDIAKSCGKPCEDFNITTEDGYILQQFHIPGNTSKLVLLIHGIMESSDTYIQRKNSSLAIILATAGYDVWVANNRGNRYGRNHKTLNPDTDPEFWNFSINELGVYDIPATIDYILDRTGQTSLSIVGHSQGTTVVFILTSEKPEYNEKIKVLACLAAVAYVQHVKGRLKVGILASPILELAGDFLQYDEVFGFYSDEKSLLRMMCNSSSSYEACVVNGFFQSSGSDPSQFEPELLPTFVSYFPAGTSRKSFIHFAQIGINKEFAKYDYGTLGNIGMYGTLTPPKYNFDNMKIDVALYRGQNDFISVQEDVDRLKNQLPNVVEDITLEDPNWNHIDFTMGLNMSKYLYPHLLNLLSQYNDLMTF